MLRVIAILGLVTGCRQILGLDDLPNDAASAVDAIDASCGDACTGRVVPSNGIPQDITAGLTDDIVIGADTTFDGDTGEISGAVKRAAGEGVDAGIRFAQIKVGGVSIGVFAFHRLTVSASGAIKLLGTESIAFVVEATADLAGVIDGSAAGNVPGPGGGRGSIAPAAGDGCGGAAGAKDLPTGADSGGGGGGGAAIGGNGGTETASGVTFAGGAGGPACIPATLEPLVGGGGGGGGGQGAAPTASHGGGGGGAFQLTSFEAITVEGLIVMGGGGGDGGPPDPAGANGGAGGGGGAGGAILLEAPTVAVTSTATLAANGGGGGGGSAQQNAGVAGEAGRPSTIAAKGGVGASNAGAGGDGGTGTVAAQRGVDTANVNSGAGGGAVGSIFLRGTVDSTGTTSPTPGMGPIRTN